MSVKGFLFISLFGICAIGALVAPQLGIYGYIADYCINPNDQWWAAPFSRFGIRYSFTLALATMAGIVIQRHKLKFGKPFFYGQELVLIFFLAVVWALTILGPETVGRYMVADHPSVKLTKIVVFCLMMTHVITDIRKLSGLFWTLTAVALILGVQAWGVPYGDFVGGRLEGIGGADFGESNFFAAFMATMLPIIGIQFLRSGWCGRLFCLVSGAFTANAVVLCRSRGSFLGLATGALIACLLAPKHYRKKIFALMIVGLLGATYVTDSYFVERILTISTSQEEMDSSSSRRLELWKAGGKIFMDNPFGIGPGNWYQTIGRYVPEFEGKDTHNTLVKCAAELGVFGISLFLILLLNAYFNLKKVHKILIDSDLKQAEVLIEYCFSIIVALSIIFVCSLTITMLYTEIVYILLMLPLCMRRAANNIGNSMPTYS